MLRQNEPLDQYFARSITNVVPDAPDHDAAILHQGQHYGRPTFRLEPQSETTAGKIWFAREGGKLQLQLHLEAYRKSPNELPLDILSLDIRLYFYYHNEQDYTNLPLTIESVNTGNATNILMNIYATLDISEDYREDIYEGFIRADRQARLEIDYRLDWAKPMPILNSGHAAELLNAIPDVLEFDVTQLQIQDSSILTSTNEIVAEFKDSETANLALDTLKHFKINKKYTIPSGIENMDFDFYLAEEHLPILDTFYTEFDKKNGKFSEGLVSIENLTQHTKPRFDFVTFPTYFDTDEHDAKIEILQELLALGNCNHVFQWGASSNLPHHANLFSDSPFQLFGRIVKNDNEPIAVKKVIPINIRRSDRYVFSSFFEDIAPIDYIWKRDIIEKGGEEFIIHYRKTADPNHYYFLPQVYRLSMDEAHYPDVRISLWSKEGAFTDYKIAVECQVQPYIHPKAQKDLIATARRQEGIKYVEKITTSGFESATFRMLSSVNVLNNIEIYAGEQLVEVGGVPVNALGFNITFVTNIEGFEYLKKEFETGKKVGQVEFMLQEETDDGITRVASNPIDVEIAVKKLSQIPLQHSIDSIQSNRVMLQHIHLTNKNPYPVSVKGVDLTLLSKVAGKVMEVDTDVELQEQSIPILISNKGNNVVKLAVDTASIDTQVATWTEVIAKPYGVYYGDDAEIVMKRIIDYSSREAVPWSLQIEYFGDWDGLHSITITLANIEGHTLDTQQLKPNETKKEALLAVSLDQYLKTSTGFNRRYKYKRTYYFVEEDKIEDEDWIESTDSETDYLLIRNKPNS